MHGTMNKKKGNFRNDWENMKCSKQKLQLDSHCDWVFCLLSDLSTVSNASKHMDDSMGVICNLDELVYL